MRRKTKITTNKEKRRKKLSRDNERECNGKAENVASDELKMGKMLANIPKKFHLSNIIVIFTCSPRHRREKFRLSSEMDSI
jgi:hypothetical protein